MTCSCLRTCLLCFLTLARGSSTSPSLLYPSATLCKAAWLNTPPLIGMSPTLSSKSAASTRRSTYLRERTASTQTSTISPTTVDASEITDTIEVGQLTSPLFSQKREVSAIPIGVSRSQQQAAASGSQQQHASSSVVNPWQDTDLKSIGKLVRVLKGHCRKVNEIDNARVCKFCLKREAFMITPLRQRDLKQRFLYTSVRRSLIDDDEDD